MRPPSCSPRLILLLVCLLALTAGLSAIANVGSAHAGKRTAIAYGSAVATDFKNLPISFERNDGQAPPEVRYVSKGLGYATYLTDREAVLVLTPPSVRPKSPSRDKGRYPEATAGGNADDIGWGVGLDAQSNAYVVGQTLSGNYALMDSLQPFRGTSDAFVTIVSPETAPTPTPTSTPTPATISFASATATVLERDGTFGALLVRSGSSSVTRRGIASG